MSREPQLFETPAHARASHNGPGVERPSWFNVGKTTPKGHIGNVARGRHPFGDVLGPADRTCGECDHAYPTGWTSKRFWKCRLVRATHGPGTDLRKRWRSCRQFKEK